MMDFNAAPPQGNTAPLPGLPPRLGAPVPGASGGLPAQAGLNVNAAPMAKQLQSMGRGNDKMLVHMTPEEVGGLQQLALASGGSLTINPQTGLPEAGWLGKLLPTLIGFGLNFIPGVGPLLAAGVTAAGTTAITGDLQKGLMAGLGAFGGASLAGAVAPAATGTALAGGAAASGSSALDATLKGADLSSFGTAAAGSGAATPAALSAATGATGAAGAGGGFLSNFSQAAQAGLPSGILQKAAPYAAGAGLLGGVSSAMQPKIPKLGDEEEGSWDYNGPYMPQPRDVSFQSGQQMIDTGGAEHKFFTPSNPAPGYRPATSLGPDEMDEYGFAEGGSAEAGLGQIPVEDFQQLTDFFQASRPGAITASMYPPVRTQQPSQPTTPTPAPTSGETAYNFNRPTTSPIAGGGIPGMGGGFDFSNIDLSGLDFSGINFGGLNGIYTPPTQQQPAPAPAPTPQTPTPGAGYTEPTYNFAPQPPAVMEQQPVPAYDYNYRDPYFFEEDFAARGPGGMMQEQMSMFARGGPVDMKDGAFVVDARTVSELGNGSSNAGMELLSRMGGRPLHGPGDGVSDSIPARIGGRQEARVARDEVVFPPEAVRRIGKGSEARGTNKLYALMDKAHKARKKAKRGEDTGLRKGLA